MNDFEACFRVEERVFVDFIRPDHDLDGGVHLHPCDVAVVVVVGQESVGAFEKKVFQRGIRREGRRLAELFGRGRERLPVQLGVGHCREVRLRCAG